MREQLFDMMSRGAWVFPLAPKQKIPLLNQSWKLTSTNDVPVVEEWLGEYPWMNYGIDLGKSSLFVVDCDMKDDADGRWGYMSLLHSHGLTTPDTFMVTTPRGGTHVFYRAPSIELGNSAGLLGPGIDTRGWGGYVVGPGSRGPQGRYEVYRDRPLSELPTQVLDLLLPKVLERPRTPVPGNLDRRATLELGWAIEALTGLHEGNRHDVLLKRAVRLGGLWAQGVFQDRQTLEAALWRGVGLMADRYPEAAAARDIADGLDWGYAHPMPVMSVPPVDLAG